MDLKEKNELLPHEQSHQEESYYGNSSQINQEVSRNDLDLLDELHKKYSVGIYNRCITLFGNEAIVKEAISYILLEGYLYLSKATTDVPDRKQFFNHLTYHLSINIAQKASHRNKIQIFSTPTFNSDYPSQKLFQKEILNLDTIQLKEILDNIQIGDKALLLMRYQDDMSLEEIAKAINFEVEETQIKLRNAQKNAIELKSNLA